MVKTLVSILIPVYNREELVRIAIESAINQTYENIEVIAVDNKSTDRTYGVLKEYAEKYPNVKVYQNEENLGPVRNWQKCLEYSSGEYIKILFSDDWIEEDFVEKCMEILLANDDVGFVYTKTYQIYNQYDGMKTIYINDIEGKKKRYYFITESVKLYRGGKTPVSPGCALFRKEGVTIENDIPNSLSLNHLDSGAGTDLLIYLNALKKYEYCYYTSKTTAYFVSHSGSIGATEGNAIKEYYLTALLHYINENMPDYIYGVKITILQAYPFKTFLRYKKLLRLYGFEDCSINKKDFISLGVKKMFGPSKTVVMRRVVQLLDYIRRC